MLGWRTRDGSAGSGNLGPRVVGLRQPAELTSEVTTDFLVDGNHIGIGMPHPDTFYSPDVEEATPPLLLGIFMLRSIDNMPYESFSLPCLAGSMYDICRPLSR